METDLTTSSRSSRTALTTRQSPTTSALALTASSTPATGCTAPPSTTPRELQAPSPSALTAATTERPFCSISDLDREIVEMHRVIKTGGVVFYRSAGKRPWYNQRFEKAGFKVEAVHIRETGQPTDNVNMYASFYRATKI
ncbi:unnamed protein product [Tilletia laevis]|nr:unnamed protein product [Tilletia caries]CAD6955359.1 unnamed protein product [Tilletia laevis]